MVLPAPRQAVPPFSGVIVVFFCPHSNVRGGGASRSESNKTIASGNRSLINDSVVTWEGIFQFCMVITAVIALVRQDNNNKKR